MKHAHRLLHLALCLLLLASCNWRGDRYERLLAEAEEMNRNDSLFTSDSMGLVLVRHYDHWWHTRNHRLRAYYMLGCAYRDMGEAPAALHYYHIATEQADTAHADSATYATLFRVYGQMAMVYGYQNMPLEKKEALIKYSHYAWLAHDMLNHIIAYEQMTDVCCQLDDTLGVFAYTDTAYTLYQRYGYPQMAASVYPTAIYTCLLDSDYVRARMYMDTFESESGLFDENGNIVQGREGYYYYQGMYYCGIGKIDSAEYFYRKLISYGHYYEAYKGLLSVYKARKNTDSIVKYVTLHEQALELWQGSRQSNSIIQSSAIYKYERNQNLAIQKELEAKVARYLNLLLLTLLALLLIFSLFAFYYFRQRSFRKEQERQKLADLYEEAKTEYWQKCNDYDLLQHNYDVIRQTAEDANREVEELTSRALIKKNAEIWQLKRRIADYEEKMGIQDAAQIEESMEKYHVVKKCRIWSEQGGSEKPTSVEVEKILQIYERNLPKAYLQLSKAKLSRQEMLVCVLLLLRFDTYQITHLLDKAPQSITNSKATANRKLFGEKGVDSLLRNLKQLVRCNLM
mgnify:FL=1